MQSGDRFNVDQRSLVVVRSVRQIEVDQVRRFIRPPGSASIHSAPPQPLRLLGNPKRPLRQRVLPSVIASDHATPATHRETKNRSIHIQPRLAGNRRGVSARGGERSSDKDSSHDVLFGRDLHHFDKLSKLVKRITVGSQRRRYRNGAGGLVEEKSTGECFSGVERASECRGVEFESCFRRTRTCLGSEF